MLSFVWSAQNIPLTEGHSVVVQFIPIDGILAGGKSLHICLRDWILLAAIGFVCYYYFGYAIVLKAIENTCKIKSQ